MDGIESVPGQPLSPSDVDAPGLKQCSPSHTKSARSRT